MSPYRPTKKADRDADNISVNGDVAQEQGGDTGDNNDQAGDGVDDKEGVDIEGVDAEGVDAEGVDVEGVDAEGEDVIEEAIAEVALFPLSSAEASEARSALKKVSFQSLACYIFTI